MNQNKKTILGLYALIGAGSLMMVTPFSIIPFAGISCAFVGFIACYFYRWKHKDNEDIVFHTSYLIRTTWWSSLILLVGVIVFGSIIFGNGDTSMIDQMIKSAERGIIPNEGDIMRMQIQFVQTNQKLIMLAAIIALLPYPAFLLYRIIKGARLVVKKEG